MFHKKLLFSIFFLFFILFCKSQERLSEVQLDKIEPQKVQDYLQNQIENDIHTFSDIKPSLNHGASVSGYLKDKRKYLVKGSLEKVWNHYIFTEPRDAWDCNKINYGLLFSKKDQRLFYSDDHIAKMDTGQLIFLNLKLLGGIKNLGVAFEIITIDEKEKIIAFSYIKGNTSEGKQQLKFVETKKGFTQIIHESFFRSKSKLRDRLYPFFHTRMTNKFHRNMKKFFKLNG